MNTYKSRRTNLNLFEITGLETVICRIQALIEPENLNRSLESLVYCDSSFHLELVYNDNSTALIHFFIDKDNQLGFNYSDILEDEINGTLWINVRDEITVNIINGVSQGIRTFNLLLKNRSI